MAHHHLGSGHTRRPRPGHPRGGRGRVLGYLPDGSSPARPGSAPVGQDRGGALADRTEGVLQGLASAAERGLIPDPDAVQAVRQDAVSAPGWAGPALWIHGDLHPANVLTADGTPAA
jgi:hypothetical protein